MSLHLHRKISHQNSCKYLVIESSLPAVMGQSRMHITTFIGSNFAANQHPKANSPCERVIGTLRRECLDFLIPLTENHLRLATERWVTHYNRGRPHGSLGPCIPDPPVDLPVTPHKHRHWIPNHCKFLAHPILCGLHHEYGLVTNAA